MRPSTKPALTTLGKAFALLGLAAALSAIPAPAEAKITKAGTGVLILPNANYSHDEYVAVRAALEAAGLEIRVAAGTLAPCVPWGGSLDDAVQPDMTIAAVDPSSYVGVVFIGGWGSSAYQYAFDGTYLDPIYSRDRLVTDSVNRLIGAFLAQGKPVGAVGHAVTVLAWARVDGVSPLRKKTVSAWAGGGPAFSLGGRVYSDATISTRWHVEKNGGAMPLSSAIGNPTTDADDVWVDGKIITAENVNAIDAFAKTYAGGVRVAVGDL